jgi:hypothetical protein
MRKFVLLLALLLTACVEEELPITVKYVPPGLVSNMNNDAFVPGPGKIVILAKGDITIKQVTLNRGNCPSEVNDLRAALGLPPLLPQVLSFGQELAIPANCRVLEAAIETDKGSTTFTWN